MAVGPRRGGVKEEAKQLNQEITLTLALALALAIALTQESTLATLRLLGSPRAPSQEYGQPAPMDEVSSPSP